MNNVSLLWNTELKTILANGGKMKQYVNFLGDQNITVAGSVIFQSCLYQNFDKYVLLVHG